MSTAETVEPTEAHDPADHDVDTHDHPGDRKYVEIAIILAILTALEVATYFFEEELGDALIPILMVMMVVKFFLVAAWFMHLKFDSRLFSRLFVAGLVLASAVYIAMLAAFEFWS
jgi:cytochrome c oxidase subunit 4